MKRSIVFLLLFALLLCFCGCEEENIRGRYEDDSEEESSEAVSGTSSTDDGVSDNSDVSQETSDESSENSEASDDASSDDTSSDDTSSDETSSDDSSSDDDSSASNDFSIGNVKGRVYVNEFIGICYKLDDGWTFYDDDQIKALNNITMDVVGDELKELLKNAPVVYDMYATDSSQLNNVLVNLEKINPLQLAGLNIAENFKASIPLIKSGFTDMGYTNVNCEVVKVEVDGKNLDALRTTAEIGNIKLYQISVAVKCNGYLACLAATTYYNDTTADLLDNVEWLNLL